MPERIIVVGAGREQLPSKLLIHANVARSVSGLSAAHTIYLAGGNVLLLDKNGKPTCCPTRAR
jgi:hypothetical protein